jgi:hypothetical protein
VPTLMLPSLDFAVMAVACSATDLQRYGYPKFWSVASYRPGP